VPLEASTWCCLTWSAHRRTALLSFVLIIKDLIPGYTIRDTTGEDKKDGEVRSHQAPVCSPYNLVAVQAVQGG